MSNANDALLALAEQNIAELQAENAKLRDDLETQRETAWHNTIRNAREYKRVCDENDRLRELLGESLMDYKLYAKKYGLPPYLSDVNEHLDARLRELGIEVPE